MTQYHTNKQRAISVIVSKCFYAIYMIRLNPGVGYRDVPMKHQNLYMDILEVYYDIMRRKQTQSKD